MTSRDPETSRSCSDHNKLKSDKKIGTRDVIGHDHASRHRPFPIGGPMEPSLYL